MHVDISYDMLYIVIRYLSYFFAMLQTKLDFVTKVFLIKIYSTEWYDICMASNFDNMSMLINI